MKKISKKQIWLIVLCSVIFVAIAGSIIGFCVYTSINKVKLYVTAAQVDNEQSVKVDWSADKLVDEVKIEIFHNGGGISSKSLLNYNEISKGTYTETTIYGKQKIKVSVKRNGVTTSTEKEVSLSANEYNFAPLVATMPVTLFSLEIDNITNNGSIPTFVWLERYTAWDYSKLPANVHLLPTLTKEQNTNGNVTTAYTETAKYVKELYEINPNSKFHFYFNDLWSSGLIEATYANNLPETSWDAVLLSDGTASFQEYNSCFNNENADQTYATMVEKFNTLKVQVKKTGSYSSKDGKSYAITPGYDCGKYAYIMAEQNENITWEVTGLQRTFAPNNDKWSGRTYEQDGETVKGKILQLQDTGRFVRMNIGDYFNSSSPKYLDSEKQTQLKELYDFTQVAGAFKAAQDAGKKIMIIIGSSPANTTNYLEANMEINVKALKALYGDEYAYFYKGHPGYPTYNYPTKLEALEKLGLVDVDSSIAAEFFFFFYPEAYGAGIQSSTFISVDADHVLALFNTKPTDSNSGLNDYKAKVDVFMSNGVGTIYETLVNENENQWLLQFVDGYSEEYDAAIYNMTNNTLTYYKDGVAIAA